MTATTTTWTSKSFPTGVQNQERIFETDERDAVQQFSRDSSSEYVRTPATLDASMRHMMRHVLLNPRFVDTPLQHKLWYCDDRFRQIRHNYKVNYQSDPSPNAFSWLYYQVRLLLTRVAASTVSRESAIKFAHEKYPMMQRLTGTYDGLLPVLQGPWQERFAPIVSLIVLHHGLKLALSNGAKCESCGTWCLDATGGIYQLEHPSQCVNLETAYQAVTPEAARCRVVQNSLLLLHALHAGEWFRFIELTVSLNLTFAQKCYVFSCLTYVRFRAVADTFGRPRKPQKPRLCDSVDVTWLTQKLLFADENDCRSFLDDVGVIVIADDNSSTSRVNMQGTLPEEYFAQGTEQPSPIEMREKMRNMKDNSEDRLHQWGIYLPHPDFFQLQKAHREFKQFQTSGPVVGSALDLAMLIQQPDGAEQNSDNNSNNNVRVADSIESWLEATNQELDPSNSNRVFDENAWECLSIKAPSMFGRDAKAATQEFDRIIDQERMRLAGKRVAVLSEKLLREYEENALTPLEELFRTEIRVLSSQETRERTTVIEKLREQRRQRLQQEKEREEEERKKKQQQQQQQEEKKKQQPQSEKEKEQKPASPTTTTTTTNKVSFADIFNKPTATVTSSNETKKVTTTEATASSTSFKNPFANFSASATAVKPMTTPASETTTSKTLTTEDTAEKKKPDDFAKPTAASLSKVQQPATKDDDAAPKKQTVVTFNLPSTTEDEKKKIHAQQQRQQLQPDKTKKVTSSEVVSTPLTYDKSSGQLFYPRPSPFPFIDIRGFHSWLPKIVDQLKQMWMIKKRGEDFGGESNNNDEKLFFPEYSSSSSSSSTTTNIFEYKHRVETDQVHLKIVVITPTDEDDSTNNNNNSYHQNSPVSSSVTSLFYDPESCDKQQGLLCQRTFTNGDATATSTHEDYDVVCNSPTFRISAVTLPWRKCLDTCSQTRKVSKTGSGVLAVLVFDDENDNNNSLISGEKKSIIGDKIEDLFSSFLRQFNDNSSTIPIDEIQHLRGVVVLSEIFDRDEEKKREIEQVFAEKYSGFSTKFNELLQIRLDIELKKQAKLPMNFSDSSSKNNSRRRDRNDQQWEMSRLFWMAPAENTSSSSSRVEQDSSAKTNNNTTTTSVNKIRALMNRTSSLLLEAPPLIVVPTKEPVVRMRLGSALSDSMVLIVKEIRRQQYSN